MEVRCIKLGVCSFKVNYFYAEHAHRHAELDLVLCGRCIMAFGQERVALRAGEGVLVASGTPHSFMVSDSQPCCISQFEFEVQDAPPDARRLLGGEEPFYRFSRCGDLKLCLADLHRYRADTSFREYAARLFSLEFEKLLLLLQLHAKQSLREAGRAENELATGLLRYLNSHFSEDIDFEAYARQHKISSSYLRRIFLRHVGLNGLNYLTALRMEKAKELLLNSELPVSEIALQAGYHSPAYFSNVFRKKVGLSPSEFRSQPNGNVV